MATSVRTWEDLPAGDWLETDESGTHWYLDHKGNHWYSDESGYHLYKKDESEEPETFDMKESDDISMETDSLPQSGQSSTIKIIAGVSVLLIVALIVAYLIYDDVTEPTFYDEVYWTDSGRAFVFGADNIQIAYPSNNDNCEEWTSESQTFTEVDSVCMAESLVSDYSIQFNGGDTYETCFVDQSKVESCYKIHVFSDGIVMRNLYVAEGQVDVCRILLNSIGPSTVNSQSMHLYSKVIINDRIRFDIEDSWTAQFLLESRDIYNEAKSTDCFFEQFEYTGPRVVFDVADDPAELTEAVNDSLTWITVSQAEYTAPYEDIEVYVYAETREFDCQPIQMIERESGWERVVESEASCISELYNSNSGDEYTISLSIGDQLIIVENNEQICNDKCEIMLEIRHHGKRIYSGYHQLE
ncbi:MAG: Uncharacterised protein [Candidatus Poseidoniaceae archaeon]|nr:MAG: Uncharacterised protein [Candidatus Poseidoniaceae archaeon]